MKVLVTDDNHKISKALAELGVEVMKADEDIKGMNHSGIFMEENKTLQITNRKARRAAKAKRRKEDKALAKQNKVRLIYNPYTEEYEPEF